MSNTEITNEMRIAVVNEMTQWARLNMPMREMIPFIGALCLALSEVGKELKDGPEEAQGA